MRKLAACPLLALSLLLLPEPTGAQESLLDQRWHRLQSANFIVVSEVSARQTRRVVQQLEVWRQLAARILTGGEVFGPTGIPNRVFLFADARSMQPFAMGQESALFQVTPRANFMAVVADDEVAWRTALHHYGHFLQKNFTDLRLPRWYEEGMSGYLAQMQITGNRAKFRRSKAEWYQAVREWSETLAMERLFYRDQSLASPRLIQIANLKSEWLIHYLRHGHEDGWPDRRQQLQRYLQLIRQGRTTRYAFDQAFDVTAAELDGEFHAFLGESSRPAGKIPFRAVEMIEPGEPLPLSRAKLAVALGELALNAGQAATAELLFAAALEEDPSLARAFSGMGDALRFQQTADRDQEIAAYFEQAVALAPHDPDILLDYGEYWEAELTDCSKRYPAPERAMIIDRITRSFRQALDRAPDSAEANLAMGQVYLFPERQWHDGLAYQQKAFALLPGDSFIREQAARYAIAAGSFAKAEELIDELAQPMHAFGVPDYVNRLRQRMQSKINNEEYQDCVDQ